MKAFQAKTKVISYKIKYLNVWLKNSIYHNKTVNNFYGSKIKKCFLFINFLEPIFSKKIIVIKCSFSVPYANDFFSSTNVLKWNTAQIKKIAKQE